MFLSQIEHNVYITKMSLLMLFKEIVVYPENYTGLKIHCIGQTY